MVSRQTKKNRETDTARLQAIVDHLRLRVVYRERKGYCVYLANPQNDQPLLCGRYEVVTAWLCGYAYRLDEEKGDV